MTDLQQIRELKKQYEDMIAKVGKKSLKPYFDAFFAASPEAKAVTWTAYTPYFNDGEPCTFRLGDFGVILETDDPEEDDYEAHDSYDLNAATRDVADGEEQITEIDYAGRKRTYMRTKWKTIPVEPLSHVAYALETLERGVSDEDIMLSIFGDHVRVTATREGFEVDEYSHD